MLIVEYFLGKRHNKRKRSFPGEKVASFHCLVHNSHIIRS
jgi:hypothetical protein